MEWRKNNEMVGGKLVTIKINTVRATTLLILHQFQTRQHQEVNELRLLREDLRYRLLFTSVLQFVGELQEDARHRSSVGRVTWLCVIPSHSLVE